MSNTFFQRTSLTLLIFLISTRISWSQESNWTHFRGSDLRSIAEVDHIPVQWDTLSHTVWKMAIHGRGWSSPVIYGNQIWLTTATENGKELSAVCVDFNTGDIIHDLKVFTIENPPRKHSINSFATPTAAIEEGFVYVHYGSMGTACINTTSGKVQWTRTDLVCNHVQGPGSSAYLYKDLLILHYEGTDIRFIIALDKHTGETVWKTDRPEEPYKSIPEIGCKAYVTPLPVRVNGRDLIISNGSAVISAIDPITGDEVWSVFRGAESTVAMPFEEHGVVYFQTGFMVDSTNTKYSEMIAVNPDGKGDITTSNVLWSKSIEPMPLSTPVIKNGLIYLVDAKRTMRCIDAQTGDEVWSTRLKNLFNASPVYADGKIYFCSTRGEIVVIEAGRSLKILAENQLDREIWATPAILRNALIIRTGGNLYKIAFSEPR